MPSPVLVTGAAGFIGFHVAQRLLRDGVPVVGVDSFTPYHDPGLKEARFARLVTHAGFRPERLNLAEEGAARDLFDCCRPRHVVHLAVQPGVRRALIEPQPYVRSNVVAFLNVLEGCRHAGVEHLLYASSSSVYGANRRLPFSEHHGADHPVSLYAATKKADQAMAHAYSHLFGLSITGLRFFTVYGPWGVPTWRFTPSPTLLRRADRLRWPTEAGSGAISPTSTTSSRASCACSTARRGPIRPGAPKTPIRRPAPPRTGSTTSATTIPRS
jgi:nucleoside-diphosphate-sugar epimerase